MAQDIIPMDAIKAKCPHCSCDLLVEWQIATHSDGGDSFQFVGLRLGEEKSAEALRKKKYPLGGKR